MTFIWTHERPERLTVAADEFLAQPWPWHKIDGLRIQARPEFTGSRYWPPMHLIGIPAHASPYELAHELGHAVDQKILSDTDRAEVRRLMGAEPETPWLISGRLSHPEVTGESFAEWFAHELGTTSRTRWGVHDWSHPDTRVRLRELVLDAAKEDVVPISLPFLDLAGADDELLKAAQWARDTGLVTGDPRGRFNGGHALTRSQLVRILYRQAGSPDA